MYTLLLNLLFKKMTNKKVVSHWRQKEIAHDWDNEVNDLNTLRRNKVMKELHNYLKNTIDLVKVRPEEIGVQVPIL